MELPQKFSDSSLSKYEYILPFPLVLEAIEHWRRMNVGCLGWELIVQYPDSKIGHPNEVIGASLDIKPSEAYDDFVERSSWHCKCSIEEFMAAEASSFKDFKLYFCVTPCEET